MIVYSGIKQDFQKEVINGTIASRIDALFMELGIRKEQQAEYRSWENSLPRMSAIISDDRIPKQAQIAIEFQIPLTSKRVDFMIGGSDGVNDNIIIIELKQWETCQLTDKENVVETYTGSSNRLVAHPCQQAYSYAKLIQNLNETLREKKINLMPCAYLHNYKETNRNTICNKAYEEIIKRVPLFLQMDGIGLQNYIAKYIRKPSKLKLFDIIEYGKLKPSKSLQDAVGEILNDNNEFVMIDEQQVAYATILKLVENLINDNQKHTVVVKGGPGTGKSVIAINLLAKILNKGFSCNYICKNSAPRYAFAESFVKGKYTLSYLKGLFNGSSSFYSVNENTFDCLLVDEAHRLNAKSGIFSNKGENQIKEIIHASKISVFFIDEDQIVTTKDIGTIKEIEKWAKEEKSVFHFNKDLVLSSQFRCNGSDGYLAFLDDLLEIKETANRNYFDIDYDIEVFDTPLEMKLALQNKNINNKCRIIAGYCYPWNSKNDKTQMDIVIGNFKAQWNFSTTGWATDKNSFDQVGCIHSSQGLEFDYVGIIIGNDLIYKNNHVITDYTKRAKSDASLKGIKTCKNYSLADKIIRNTYRTLLSRGQKGCYIYCENKELSDYIRNRLKKVKNSHSN